MKPTLAAGLSYTKKIDVDRDRTIGFMGEEGRVYATPALVRDIEQTCRDFLLQHLDAGEDSVGTRVELDHLAPTLMNMSAEIAVTIAEVKGRLVTFDVTAKDALDQIGKGRHIRFVSDVAKTKERLKAKATRVKELG